MREIWTPLAASADSTELNVVVAAVILACLLMASLFMARSLARERARRRQDY